MRVPTIPLLFLLPLWLGSRAETRENRTSKETGIFGFFLAFFASPKQADLFSRQNLVVFALFVSFFFLEKKTKHAILYVYDLSHTFETKQMTIFYDDKSNYSETSDDYYFDAMFDDIFFGQSTETTAKSGYDVVDGSTSSSTSSAAAAAVTTVAPRLFEELTREECCDVVDELVAHSPFLLSAFKISTITAMGDLSQAVKLAALANDREAVVKPAGTGKKMKNQITLSFVHNSRKISVQVFATGKFNIAGLPSLDDLPAVCSHVKLIVVRNCACERPALLQVTGHRVVMVKTSASFPMPRNKKINLLEATRRMEHVVPHARISYEPERFAAVKVQDVVPRATVSIFASGHVAVSAASVNDNCEAFQRIADEVMALVKCYS